MWWNTREGDVSLFPVYSTGSFHFDQPTSLANMEEQNQNYLCAFIGKEMPGMSIKGGIDFE